VRVGVCGGRARVDHEKLEDRRIKEIARNPLAALDGTATISHANMVAYFEVVADGLRD
jgi:hypothetical protein